MYYYNNIKNKYMSFINSLKSLLGMSVEVEQAPIVEVSEPVIEAPVAAAPVMEAPVVEAPVAAPEATAAVENVMNDPMVSPVDTALDTNIEIIEPAPAATSTENA